MRALVSGLAGMCIAASMLTAAPAHAAMVCTTAELPVAPSAGQAKSWNVSTTLCVPVGGASEIDVMVHGGTYNGSYWNWPVQPDQYSYVRRTVNSGRAALYYDRPGAGSSSRPASAVLNVATDAHIVHQLIGWSRERGYREVNLIGHSLGSIIAMTTAAQYSGIDRVVITGMLHLPGLGPGSVTLFGSFYPALLDPKDLGKLLDAGYVTTMPNTRASSFYHRPAADPAVIEHDEETKDLMSLVEMTDAVARLAIVPPLNDTNHITEPVLVVVGAKDSSLCGLLVSCATSQSVLDNERPYYSKAESLTARSIPDTGHSLPLHPSGGESFKIIDEWIDAH